MWWTKDQRRAQDRPSGRLWIGVRNLDIIHNAADDKNAQRLARRVREPVAYVALNRAQALRAQDWNIQPNIIH